MALGGLNCASPVRMLTSCNPKLRRRAEDLDSSYQIFRMPERLRYTCSGLPEKRPK